MAQDFKDSKKKVQNNNSQELDYNTNFHALTKILHFVDLSYKDLSYSSSKHIADAFKVI